MARALLILAAPLAFAPRRAKLLETLQKIGSVLILEISQSVRKIQIVSICWVTGEHLHD